MLDYSKKYSSEELLYMDPVSAYKIILYGKFNKNFPNGFWDSKEGKKNSITIIKWLIDEKLKLTRQQKLESVNVKFFSEYKLRGMLCLLFNDSPIEAIMECYPSEFKVYEFKRVPNKYWNKETAIESVKWLIGEKFKFTEDEIKTKCSYKFFKSNNLGGMLDIVFNGSSCNAIMSTYPDRFKPWELVNCPRSYWNNVSGIEATKWLIEERLKVDLSSYKVTFKDFKDNGLDSMLRVLYNSCYKEALKKAYPNVSL